MQTYQNPDIIGDKKIYVVSFLDRVAPKNKLQIEVIRRLGYSPVFFVNSFTEYAGQYFEGTDKYFVLELDFFARLRQVYKFLKNNYQAVHHVEIYPGGRFSFIYMLLAYHFNLSAK